MTTAGLAPSSCPNPSTSRTVHPRRSSSSRCSDTSGPIRMLCPSAMNWSLVPAKHGVDTLSWKQPLTRANSEGSGNTSRSACHLPEQPGFSDRQCLVVLSA
jgi:hypothetical protein